MVRRNWKQIKGEECQRAWAVWLKEEPSTSKRPRTRGLHSCCPVHGCNARSKHPKHHVWDCHIQQVSGITHVGVRMVSRLPPPPCLVSANHGEMAVRPCRYFGSSCGACGFNYFPAQRLPHHRQLQEADIGPCLHDEVAKDPCVILHSLSGPAPLIYWRILVARLLACPQRWGRSFYR